MHINRNKRKAKVEEIKPVEIKVPVQETLVEEVKVSTKKKKKTLLELIEEEEENEE